MRPQKDNQWMITSCLVRHGTSHKIAPFVIKAAEPQRTKSRATGAGRSGISLQYCFLTITSTYWARELSTGTQIFGTITRANGLYLYLAAIPRSTTNVCLNQRFVTFCVLHRAYASSNVLDRFKQALVYKARRNKIQMWPLRQWLQLQLQSSLWLRSMRR